MNVVTLDIETIERVLIVPPKQPVGLLMAKRRAVRDAFIAVWEKQERYASLERVLAWMNIRDIPRLDGDALDHILYSIRESHVSFLREAAASGRAQVLRQVRKSEDDPGLEAMEEWIDQNTGEWLEEISARQKRILKNALYRAVIDEEYTAEELAAVIQKSIGLTEQQTASLQNYYRGLRAQGIKPARAKQLMQRRRKQMRKDRARMIADTELNAAWNQGGLAAMVEMQMRGEVSRQQTKTWFTVEDEKVCDICAPLNNKTVYLKNKFRSSAGWFDAPPAHPRCRCGIEYTKRRPSRR